MFAKITFSLLLNFKHRRAIRLEWRLCACAIALLLPGYLPGTDLTHSAESWSTDGITLTVDGNEGMQVTAGRDVGRMSATIASTGAGDERMIEIVLREVEGVIRVFGILPGDDRVIRLGDIRKARARLEIPKELAGAGEWRILVEFPGNTVHRLEAFKVVATASSNERLRRVLDAAYAQGQPRHLPAMLAPLAQLEPGRREPWDSKSVRAWAATQPTLQRMGPWIVARSERMLAIFLEVDNCVTLENLVDLETGVLMQNHRSFVDITNIWKVLANDRADTGVEPGSEWSVSIKPGGKDGAFIMAWEAPEGAAVRSVRADVLLDDSEGAVRWGMEWTVTHPGELYACVYPRIGGVRSVAPNDQLFVPRGHGLIHDNAFQTKASYDFTYPSPFMMQFGCYASRKGRDGIYWAVHDSAGIIKRMTIATATDGMSFAFTHYANHGSGLKSWGMTYPVETRPFAGDWFDAAVIYRKWAREQPWTARGRMPDGERSRLLEADGWLWEGNGWRWEADYLAGYLEAFADYRLMVLNYNWRKDRFDENYPVYIAANAGALTRHIQDLHKKGHMWMPYFNVRAWQRETESWKARGAGDHEIINRDGKPAVEFFKGNAQSIMSPASDFWQSTTVDFVTDAQEKFAVDGAYLDQLGASFPKINYRPGSPDFGNPAAWTEGQYQMARRVIDACCKEAPEFMITTESCTELFIPYRDGNVLFYIKYLNDFYRWVPAYQAVYHPYDLTFGQPILPTQPQYYYTAAIDINSGNMPFLNMQAASKDAGDAVGFFKSCMDVYRRHRPFLAWGDMMRPPQIEAERMDIDWEWKGRRGVAMRQPCVLGSAWRAPDGRVLLLVVNHTAEPQPFSFEYAGGWTPAEPEIPVTHGIRMARKGDATTISGTLAAREILPLMVKEDAIE